MTRQQTLLAMQQVMGKLPPHPANTPPRITEEFARVDAGGDGCVRIKLAYEAEPGDAVPAYLILPGAANRKSPAAAVLCLHQTMRMGKGHPAGLDGSPPNLRYAIELARRGFVTLVPDYPNFGDYLFNPYEHGYESATMKGIVNHRRAVDLLLAGYASRVGVIGHSLGGHNALFLAAFDERVRATVTSCGFTSFEKYYKGDLTGWSHKGYMPRIATVYGKSPRQMPFDFADVLAAIAPRPIFVNAPLRDANFDASGVDDCARGQAHVTVRHPDAEHDFPPEIRQEAYDFLASRLS